MDMLPSADQQALADTTAKFCSEYAPLSSIRDQRDQPSAFDPKVWLAGAELGLLGVAAGEDVGGSGQHLDDEALVFRELGRALARGPFLGSVLGAALAAHGGDVSLANRIVEGHVTVALALPQGAQLTPDSLVGELRLIDAAEAGYALVFDDAGAGLVDIADLGEVTPLPCIDPGSRLARARAADAPVVCWVSSDDHPVLLRGAVLAAAQLVGIAEACRDITTEFATARVQFGKPIGVNQAVKHRCVDMAVASEAALHQTLFAAVCLREGRPDAEFQVRAAKVVAGRAAIDNAAAAIQLHGGMGFTYEHDIHLYLERAHVVDLVLGSSVAQMSALLALKPAQ